LSRLLGPFPDDEFDLDVSRILVLKNIKMVMACFHYYKWYPKNMGFDYYIKAIHKAYFSIFLFIYLFIVSLCYL